VSSTARATDKDNRPRYLYFRKAGLRGPIADLEAQLEADRER
jgi:hypothetical protein